MVCPNERRSFWAVTISAALRAVVFSHQHAYLSYICCSVFSSMANLFLKSVNKFTTRVTGVSLLLSWPLVVATTEAKTAATLFIAAGTPQTKLEIKERQS